MEGKMQKITRKNKIVSSKETSRNRLFFRLLFLLLLTASFIVGYILGTSITLYAVYDVASNFIDIDYDEVEKALFQYRNNIHDCYDNKLKGGYINYGKSNTETDKLA